MRFSSKFDCVTVLSQIVFDPVCVSIVSASVTVMFIVCMCMCGCLALVVYICLCEGIVVARVSAFMYLHRMYSVVCVQAD